MEADQPVDFESAAQELEEISEQGVATVSALAGRQMKLEMEIAHLEDRIKKLKKEHLDISTDKLPALMAEYGITALTLADGSTLNVKKVYGASISEERRTAAFTWLQENGYGDLIKNMVSASFVRGQDEAARNLERELEEKGMTVSSKQWVEPMTLKAWVKGLCEAGTPPPADTFGLFVGDVTSIKTPKR
jgi:hypothetical protein